jgi:hypothetical protein
VAKSESNKDLPFSGRRLAKAHSFSHFSHNKRERKKNCEKNGEIGGKT